jgi:hypothetical protein
MRCQDLTGQKFSRLVVLKPLADRFHGSVVWECRCDCGATTRVVAYRLKQGVTKSCGCWDCEATTLRNIARTKHGHAKTYNQSPTYRIWQGMINRCENPKHRNYKHYGAKGITVHPRWRASFEAFLADMGERPLGLTLDRKKPHLGYGPDNCRWATDAEQAVNRRSTRWLTFKGETLHLSEWCRRLGCKVSALRMRLSKGWPLGKALTQPFENRKPRKEVNPVPLEWRKAKTDFRQRYRHLLRGPGDDLTFEQWQEIRAKHGNRCAYCEAPDPKTLDHVVPLSKGGLHTASNVVPACKSCNSRKGTKRELSV